MSIFHTIRVCCQVWTKRTGQKSGSATKACLPTTMNFKNMFSTSSYSANIRRLLSLDDERRQLPSGDLVLSCKQKESVNGYSLE